MSVAWFRVVRGLALASVVARLASGGSSRPTLRSVVASRPIDNGLVDDDRLTVVIPARDEADRIGPAIAAVVGAPDVREVIVVDDQSSDSTVAIAAAGGARVVVAGERPPGWAGKAWALQRGVESATTDWVLCLDADTRAHPQLPSALVDRAVAERLDLLTAAGRFRSGRPGATWLHASMLATLVYRFGPPGTPGRMIANGQCMLLRRQPFLDRGGMEPVAVSPGEDVALARWMSSHQRRVEFVDASDLLEVEPYASFGETWSGWGRSLGLPGVDSLARRALDLLVITLTMPLPVARLVARRADLVDVAAICVRVGTLVGMRSAYERSVVYWLSPIADPVSVMSLTLGLGRRRQTWRGRVYRSW